MTLDCCKTLWALGALGIAVPLQAFAQTSTGADSGTLEEVVVTAEKRVENIQDVPIAITAFSESDLRAKGIVDIHCAIDADAQRNLDEGSPFSGSNSVLSASIRGIGQDDFAFNLDPGVGVYVDGVYYARTVGANQNLLDVERVEVLNGPQGTLFGRNTIGGAISIVTRTPGDQFAAQAQVTGGSFDRRDVAVMVDIPLADNLLSTFTFSNQFRDGYQKRIPYPSPTPYVSDPVGALHSSGTEAFDTQGGTNQQVGRAKFLWKATDTVTATLSLDWTHTNQPSTANTVLATNVAGPTAVFGAFYNACLLGIPFAPTAALVCGPRGVVGTPLWQANLNPATTRLLYGPAVTNTGNIDTTYATGQNFDKMNSYGGALTLDWALDPAFTLRSITGWRALHWTPRLRCRRLADRFLRTEFAEGQHQISEEVQLIGDLLDSRLKLVGGLYYFNEGGYIHDFVTFGGGLLQIDGPNIARDHFLRHLPSPRLQDHRCLWADTGRPRVGGSQDLRRRPAGPEPVLLQNIAGCYPPSASASADRRPADAELPAGAGLPQSQQPVPGVPVRREPPELQRVHAHGGHAVSLRPGSHGVLLVRQGVQDRRLDHAPDGAAAARIPGAVFRARRPTRPTRWD